MNLPFHPIRQKVLGGSAKEREQLSLSRKREEKLNKDGNKQGHDVSSKKKEWENHKRTHMLADKNRAGRRAGGIWCEWKKSGAGHRATGREAKKNKPAFRTVGGGTVKTWVTRGGRRQKATLRRGKG